MNERITAFDRFLTAARTSRIPEDFYAAAENVVDSVSSEQRQNDMDDVDQVWRKSARRLFGVDFKRPDEALYAIQYVKAIASVKQWYAENQKVQDTDGDIETIGSSADTLRKNAEIECGLVVIYESRGKEKYSKNLLEKIILKAKQKLGMHPSEGFAKIRDLVEGYFKNKASVSS